MTGKHLSHFLIEAELGRDGMGIVYRARDTKWTPVQIYGPSAWYFTK